MAPRLAILAGGGDLPGRLAETCRSAGRDVVLVALEGQAEPDRLPPDLPAVWFRMGAVGAILDHLRKAGVGDIALAGRVRRPSLAELRPDWKAAQILARVGALALGDDGLLRAVAAVLEAEGFRVVGVPDLMADLLMPAGPVGGLDAADDCRDDIGRGVAVARTLGRLDVGQAVVVQQGIVLGVEAIEGTDALIDRCGDLKRKGRGPVLVKVRKPQQDRRLDLPTIGTETVARAARAGFAGIAAEAGSAILLGRDQVARAADAAGLFVVGIPADAEESP
ncbi:LpxI family protein [Rhodocista pekingensis]|uniref:LpxI family protein n=1 Tax=Rhodocista pekingensis TaxID=201185 RepID=A0ABW2KSE0_9PROT